MQAFEPAYHPHSHTLAVPVTFQSSACVRDRLLHLFTHCMHRRLVGSVRAVGPAISCEGTPFRGDEDAEWRRNPHVQSYLLATDRWVWTWAWRAGGGRGLEGKRDGLGSYGEPMARCSAAIPPSSSSTHLLLPSAVQGGAGTDAGRREGVQLPP